MARIINDPEALMERAEEWRAVADSACTNAGRLAALDISQSYERMAKAASARLLSLIKDA